jgi:alpha-galactosidase
MKRKRTIRTAAGAFVAVAAFFLVLAQPGIRALTNGLALTPPMGWNSWNKFGCKIDEKTVREIADAMVSSGMRDAG